MDQAQITGKLQEYSISLLAHGQIESLNQQLNQFNTADIAKQPLLSVLEAWTAILTGDLQRSKHFTLWAEQSITQPTQGLPEGDFQAHIAALKAAHAFFISDPVLALEQSNTALIQFSECSDWIKSVLFFIQGYGSFQIGKLPSAQQSLEQAGATGLKSDNLHTTVLAQCMQSWILRIQGKLQQAQQIIHSAKRLCQRSSVTNSPLTTYLHIEQSRIYFERYQLQEAFALLTEQLNILAQIQEPESHITSKILLVRLQLEMRDHISAQQTMAETTKTAETTGYEDNFAELRSQQAVMALIVGNIPGCLNKLPLLSTLQKAVDVKQFIPTLVYSGLLLYEKRDQACYELVQPWVEMSKREALWGWYIEFGLQAVRAQLTKKPEQALSMLEDLIKLARPEGLLRPFAQRRYWLTHLLPELSIESRAFITSGIRPSSIKNKTVLSRRESDVLVLVAQGQSNQELAETLHISLGTVKTHIHHILKKLEVDNRTAAVAAARKLGLV